MCPMQGMFFSEVVRTFLHSCEFSCRVWALVWRVHDRCLLITCECVGLCECVDLCECRPVIDIKCIQLCFKKQHLESQFCGCIVVPRLVVDGSGSFILSCLLMPMMLRPIKCLNYGGLYTILHWHEWLHCRTYCRTCSCRCGSAWLNRLFNGTCTVLPCSSFNKSPGVLLANPPATCLLAIAVLEPRVFCHRSTLIYLIAIQ
jgi:hypothetical protein